MVFVEKYSLVHDETDALISIFKNRRPCEVAKKIMKYFRRYDKSIVAKEFRFVRLSDAKVYKYCAWIREKTDEELKNQKKFMNFENKFIVYVKKICY